MTRIALVTGGARGLGRAIAERLAIDGVGVIMADLDAGEAQRAAEALTAAGALASALQLDVSNEGSVSSAYAEIERRVGRLDILINNAGIRGLQDGRRVAIEETSFATWERTLRVNLTGTLLMCRGAVPLLRQSPYGRIVNMSSRTARARASAGCGGYATSKAAIIGLSQVLAGELGPDRITVNCVAPSTVKTAMTAETSAGQKTYFESAAAQAAVGRLSTALDVAEAVAYLCSPEAAFVTGAVLDVSGGSAMV